VSQRVGRGIALLLHDRGARRGEWSAARSGHTLPRGRTGTNFTGGRVGLRAGLDGRKISSHRDSIPDRPVRSRSLYGLSYRAHIYIYIYIYIKYG